MKVSVPVVEGKPRQFLVELFNTGTKEFPGAQVGAYEDKGVKVPFYWPVENVLKDIIRHKLKKDWVYVRAVIKPKAAEPKPPAPQAGS